MLEGVQSVLLGAELLVLLGQLGDQHRRLAVDEHHEADQSPGDSVGDEEFFAGDS